MAASAALSVMSPEGGAFARYLSCKYVSSRCWEKEEEFMLAKRWREHEDLDPARQLAINSRTLRLVAKIAMG